MIIQQLNISGSRCITEEDCKRGEDGRKDSFILIDGVLYKTWIHPCKAGA